jgi:hypothetical protein
LAYEGSGILQPVLIKGPPTYFSQAVITDLRQFEMMTRSGSKSGPSLFDQNVWWNRHTPICLAAFKARRNGTRAKASSRKTMIVFLAISARCLSASTEFLNRRQVYTWIQICLHSQRRRPCRLRCCKRDNRLPCMSSRLLASSLSLHFLPPRPIRAPSSDRRPG